MKLLPALRQGFIVCSIALTTPVSANISPTDLNFPVNSVDFYDSPLAVSPFLRFATYDPIPNCADAASKLIGMEKFKLENGVPVFVVCKTGVHRGITRSVCATDGIHRSFCINGNADSEPQNLWDAAKSILESYRRLKLINETGKIPAPLFLQPR